MIRSDIKTVTAVAPATCGNAAVGFDILGFACDALHDTVTLSLRDDKEIIIESIESQDVIPKEIDKNVVSIVVKKMCEELNLNAGFSIQIKKGIPLSSGLGGSAASSVAAAVACNAFLKKSLTQAELVRYALCGEAAVSGQIHADNVVPCVYGGLTLISSIDPLKVVALPMPLIFCVLVHPHLYVETKQARRILMPTMTLTDYVKQSAQLASFIAALYENDMSLLQKSCNDFVIEPQRTHFVPGFNAIKEAALKSGAFAMSFSGSGPTLFALAMTKEIAEKAGAAMLERLEQEGVKGDVWVFQMGASGASLRI